MLNLNLIIVPLIVLACLVIGLTLENEILLGASIVVAFIGYIVDRRLRLR